MTINKYETVIIHFIFGRKLSIFTTYGGCDLDHIVILLLVLSFCFIKCQKHDKFDRFFIFALVPFHGFPDKW